jgi:hypothetical protein
VVARLESRRQALRREEPELLVPTMGALGDQTTQRLAALGYIVTDARTVSASGPGPDPRDMMAALRRVMLAVDGPTIVAVNPTWIPLVARIQGIKLPRTDEEVVLVLKQMAERDPAFAPTLYFLAVYYTRTNRPEDAARTLEQLEAVKRAASGAG